VPKIVDKKKKKEEIIEAAIAVFSRTGYRRTKIKDIADEAGVGKGTVYEYFSSKQDLFLQMNEYFLDQYIQNQQRDLESVSDPEERIRTFITSSLEQAAIWTGFAYLTIDIWSEMDRKGEEDKLRRLMSGMLERIMDMISEYIRDGQARGTLKDFDARLVSHIILASMDGLVFQLLIKKDIFDLEAMSSTLADVLLEGLRAKGSNV
jgi:AcrR family transcriptional regulator